MRSKTISRKILNRKSPISRNANFSGQLHASNISGNIISLFGLLDYDFPGNSSTCLNSEIPIFFRRMFIENILFHELHATLSKKQPDNGQRKRDVHTDPTPPFCFSTCAIYEATLRADMAKIRQTE